MSRSLATLPKGHLHLHLEAAMRPSTLHELATQHGITVPELGPSPTFPEFLAVYEVATECLRRPGVGSHAAATEPSSVR